MRGVSCVDAYSHQLCCKESNNMRAQRATANSLSAAAYVIPQGLGLEQLGEDLEHRSEGCGRDDAEPLAQALPIDRAELIDYDMS